MESPNTQILKASEAAKYLSCGVKKIRALAKSGILTALEGFTHLRFSRTELDRYIEQSGGPHTTQQVQP